MELSFLTILVSLAVCSLLVYAVFQYTKVRLNILEQSQKEQALILQEFIEESSTDIHRLYKLSGNKDNQSCQPQGSIILEYANEHVNEYSNGRDSQSESNTKQSTYNQPHIIHLDTAFFQNKRSNLIEISSDSEDTTTESGSSDDESDSGSGSGSDDGSSDSGSDSGSDDSNDDEKIHPEIVTELIESVSAPDTEIHDSNFETESSISDIKLVTVDLGAIQQVEELIVHELSSSIDQPVDTEVTTQTQTQTPSTSTAPMTYSSMSVPELRQLLKEKYKQNPEKHPEIQKLKKAELIYALQNTHIV